MPIYEYKCDRCDARAEQLRSYEERDEARGCGQYDPWTKRRCLGILKRVPALPGQGIVKGETVYRRRL
jgi:predicted nucleic acid-binding Zn ribbon protein